MNYLVAAKNALKHGTKFIVKNSPTILTIFGVGMMGGATVKAILETPAAAEELAELEEDTELTHKEYLQQKLRVIFYHYWMTAALAFGGAGMIFWGHHITLGQTAAAIAAYNMKSDELQKLEKKIADTDGQKHLDKIHEELVKDRVINGPDGEVYDTGKGKMLCYEVISGRYFYSDVEKIRKACNDMNSWMNESLQFGEEMDVSLNEWYDYLGLERTKIGNKLGWHNHNIDLNFTSVLTVDNEPCLAIGYKNAPTWDFDMPISERGICSDDWCDRAPNVF